MKETTSIMSVLFVVVLLGISMLPLQAAIYPSQTLSGGFQSGHFDDIWDLTTGDITISFTYDANGMVDDFGGAVAHAWSEVGVRSVGSSDFNPSSVKLYWTKTVDLMAGQNNDVGDISVWRLGNYIYVKYMITSDGCYLKETHLAIADSVAGIPQTKKGNPIPGEFIYKTEHNPPVTEFTYVIDATQWAPSIKLYFAAHAIVVCLESLEESAWGYRTGDFEGANWATYFTYKPTADSSQTIGSGVWLATDYDWTANTFNSDPAGSPSLDMDDKLILQTKGGNDEGYYNLPSSPSQYWNNYGFWFDRDGVDQWQALMWGCVNGGTYNTDGVYDVVITLHATSATAGTAYMTVNGIPQGFYNGPWYDGQPDLYNVGTTFTGDMAHLQVFYGIYGYGATHTAIFEDITVTQ